MASLSARYNVRKRMQRMYEEKRCYCGRDNDRYPLKKCSACRTREANNYKKNKLKQYKEQKK